jgi:hypothetical protein
MSEKNLEVIQCFHGLEDYFNFANKTDIAEHLHEFVSQYYSDDPYPAFKRIIMFYRDKIKDDDEFQKLLNFSVQAIQKDVTLVDIISNLLRVWPTESLLKSFHKYARTVENTEQLMDLASRGQIQSKIWLVNELKKIKTDFKMVYFLAGWFGQLRLYLDNVGISYDKIRNIDIDPAACKISDQIFNIDKLDNYKVKSVELDLTDMNWLYRTGCDYKIINYTTGSYNNEKTVPDLIINTSAEHFHEDWYHKFINRPQETDPLFVIQSNNLRDIPDHINSVWSLSEMKKKFPMSRLEYEGELQLQGYKRFMLIGRP